MLLTIWMKNYSVRCDWVRINMIFADSNNAIGTAALLNSLLFHRLLMIHLLEKPVIASVTHMFANNTRGTNLGIPDS